MTASIDWYLSFPSDFMNQLSYCLDRAVTKSSKSDVTLFFRADDIGVPGRNFFRLLTLCMDFEVPMAFSMVPAWTTAARWEKIYKTAKKKANLWCWHQHGWRHANHELIGKKQEFGSSRSTEKLCNDIDRGRDKLESLLGNDFFPLFTPPWNRCDQRTLSHLSRKKYYAVSRFTNSTPKSLYELPDFFVNIDLHTRKEADPAQAWNNLLDDFASAFKYGYCGIMLHHQQMSAGAFSFLELLFSFVVHSKHIRLTSMDNLKASP